MADSKYISLKISGNPNSNDGFMPLVSFNSPSFEVPDKEYSGFDQNSYFFTVVIESSKVVYTLVKNNVRSFEAFRAGSLKIAMSIPKGYCLENGAGPIDVLLKLKDKFLERCMTCKDPVKETFEFNKGMVNPQIMDDVAKEFTLGPCGGAYQPMTPKGPIGYVITDEIKIGELLKDIQYSEFREYSMVIIAESGGSANYSAIPNLQIPRVHEYAIYVDGNYKMSVRDIHQSLICNSTKDERFYSNGSITFSIEELLNGDIVHDVIFDKVNETVRVSTVNLSKPKKVCVKIKFQTIPIQNYFIQNKNNITLTHGTSIVGLTPNLDFTLTGEEIRLLENPQLFKLDCIRKERYIILRLNFIDGNLIADVQEVAKSKTGGTDGISMKSLVPVKSSSNAFEVKLNFSEEAKKHCKKITVKAESEDYVLIQTTDVKFQKEKNNRYIGFVFVPDSWASYKRLEISYSSKKHLFVKDLNGCDEELKDYVFSTYKLGLWQKCFKRHKKLMLLLFGLLLGLVLGFAVTYTYYDNIKSLGTISNVEGGPEDGSGDGPTQELSDKEISENLANADKLLENESISFQEVNDLYEVVCNGLDAARFKSLNDKVYSRVSDYHMVVKAIQDGDYLKINELLDLGNNLHVWGKHRRYVGAISRGFNDVNYNSSQREAAKKVFMNNYSKYSCFTDLGTILLEISASHENDTEVTTAHTSGGSSASSPSRSSSSRSQTTNSTNSSTTER